MQPVEFMNRVAIGPGCWEWPGARTRNYGCVRWKGRQWQQRYPELRRRGERATGAKLTQAIVREIRVSSDTGASLSRRHGVSQTTIGRIRMRRVWAWLN